MYLPIGDDGKVVMTRGWPAEAFYYAAEPENQSDIRSRFLNFLAQVGNITPVKRSFSAIEDDIFNLSASLAKLKVLHSSTAYPSGVERFAATEVEYILFVCRSLFDLLQEVLQELWKIIALTDPSIKKKALKKSFADMTLHANEILSARAIAAKFNLPLPIAECYERHARMFLKIRQFRDDLIHRGHRIQTIFKGDSEFLIQKDLGSFRNITIWREDEIAQNHLAPLAPVINLMIHGALAAFEDFSVVLQQTCKWFDPMVPEMDLFMRGYFNADLQVALADADARHAEGRSLLSG